MYLGIDLGTSSVKTILIDADQNLIGSASADLTVQRPHTGWSEQDPISWCNACDQTLTQLAQDHADEMSAVKGIGLSGHMHGATLLDDAGTPLRPCMLWNDTRSHEQAAAMDADPAFQRITGNIVFPGFTAPKVAWVRDNERDVFAQIAKVLLPKDYLRFYLTAAFVSEMSDASGTSWLDVGARGWSEELLDKTGLTLRNMPDLVEGSAVSGTLKPDLAARWGLPADTPVAGGAGDNAAAACGLGTVDEGQAFVSLGTSGVVFTANDAYRPKPESAVHAFCHALPDTWHQMGVILSATDALNWYANLVGRKAKDLTGEMGDTLRPASSVTFLPYLSGERTPHNDAQPRGAFLDLDHAIDQTSLTHAVLQGIGFALKDNLEALHSTGSQIKTLLATGGGSQSPYWLDMLATILNIPISTPANSELGAALGAARLGMVASGLPVADVMTQPEIAKTHLPNPKLSAGYTVAYDRYRAAYPALKDGVPR